VLSPRFSSSIILSAGVRAKLLALQNTTRLQTWTHQRLATGKKVNTALDNPTNCFTGGRSLGSGVGIDPPPRLFI